MREPNDSRFRQVNRALGSHPKIGFLPMELAAPIVVAVMTARIANGVFGLRLIPSCFIGAWLLASWWLVTGGNNFRFLSRFSRWFKPRWFRSVRNYTSWTRK